METGFKRTLSLVERAWLECFIAGGAAGKEAASVLVGSRAGRRVLGRGVGGDATLIIDERAETALLGALKECAPEPFRALSEEVGMIAGPLGAPLVVVDPVDGSLNAKRGLPPFCAALAMARGEVVGDVELGFVADYTRRLWYGAVRGAGLVMGSSDENVPLGEGVVSPEAPEGSSVEVLLLEAGRPHGHEFSFRSLAELAGRDAGPEMRVRQIGSLALCLCHLGGGVADVLFAPVPSRSVDIAGGLLMVTESGGGAAALDDSDIFAQPLDLERRAPFVAWRAGLDGERIRAAARAVVR